MEGVYGIVSSGEISSKSGTEFPITRKEGLDRLIRVYGDVIAAVYKWMKKGGAQGPVIINPIEKGGYRIMYTSPECRRAGELYLLELAQKGMGIAGPKMLATDVLTEEDVLGKKKKLITVGSWAANQIAHVYVAKTLPVLQASHPKVELYIRKAHEKGHEGVISSLHRFRKDVWVVNGRSLAEAIKSACTECRLKEKRCMNQRMGPLPNHRV
jgi:hypothetical protein